MPLTDVAIRKAKPAERPYRLSDAGGLFLEVRPNGSRLWRYAFRLGGKQNLYAVGAYPAVGLQEARQLHAEARALVRAGVNPSHARASEKAARVAAGADTFAAVAGAWIEAKRTLPDRPGWSLYYEAQVRGIMERDVFPYVKGRPIRGITSAEWLSILDRINSRGAPTVAILARQLVSQVYGFAVSRLLADNDPTFPLRFTITRPQIEHAKAHGGEVLQDLMRRVAAYGGNRTTVIAVRLLLLTFVRTAELRGAPWDEFDLERALWVIPPERMKMRRRHMVPLSPQAVALLRELRQITGAGRYLFPNFRDPQRCMCATTINRAFEHMGFASGYITGHDFRATATTWLHENGWRSEVVDVQLAHAKKSRTDAAYNHAMYLPERTRMMAVWADYLDSLEAAADPIKPPRGAKLTKRQASRSLAH